MGNEKESKSSKEKKCFEYFNEIKYRIVIYDKTKKFICTTCGE